MKIARTLAAAAALIGSLALFAPTANASACAPVTIGSYQLSCAPSTDASTSTWGTGSSTDTWGTGSTTDTWGTGSTTDTWGTGSYGG